MHAAVYTLVTAVFIKAVIADYACRRLHTGNRGIYFSGYCAVICTAVYTLVTTVFILVH